MGISINNNPSTSSMTKFHYHTFNNIFLYCNYLLLVVASSCILLTFSLLLAVPSVCGFFVIYLLVFTITVAISGYAMASSVSSRWFGVYMVFTVLTVIFQGSIAVLIFTRMAKFLGELKSCLSEEDGSMILKFGGGLSVLMFSLEWVVLILAFFLKYYACMEGEGEGAASNGIAVMIRSAKVQQEEYLKDWPVGN